MVGWVVMLSSPVFCLSQSLPLVEGNSNSVSGGRRSLAGLFWRRDNAELLQQTQVVIVGRVFDNFPVGDTKDADPRRSDVFAGRWDTHQFTFMGALKGVANHDTVFFRDDVIHAEMHI